MNLDKIDDPIGIKGGTGCAWVSHITPGTTWIFIQAIALAWDEFAQLPNRIEALGEIFHKRSKTHDGVMYCTKNDSFPIGITFQDKIAAWTRPTFPEATVPNIALRALGECIEMCFAAGKSLVDVLKFLGVNTQEDYTNSLVYKEWQKHLKNWGKPEDTPINWNSHCKFMDVQSEIADVNLCITDMCALIPGADIQVVTLEKLEILKNREVGPPNELGHRQTKK